VHEASLMKGLLDIVGKAASGEGGGPVSLIHLKIGGMTGVSTDALRFAFDVMAKGTVAEGAALEIEAVPLSVRCKICGAQWRPSDFVFVCTACGSPEIDVLTGREMEVDYILVGNGETGAGDTGA
jgi:hydrogenase nickel incorporation protein HypA/HybF